MSTEDHVNGIEFSDLDYEVSIGEIEHINPQLRETLRDLLSLVARPARAKCARLRLRDQIGGQIALDWTDDHVGGVIASFDTLDLATLRPLAGGKPSVQAIGDDAGDWVARIPIVPADAPLRGEIGLIIDAESARNIVRNSRVQTAARVLRNTLGSHLRHFADTRRLAAMYLATPTLGYLLDGAGTVIAVTDLWLQHFGYRREEVIGRNARNFMTDEAQRKFMRVRDSLWRDGGCRDLPTQFVTREGESVEVLMSASVEFNQHGWPVNVKCVLNDVTELLTLQRELDSSRRTDTLTGACNGDTFQEIISRELARAERHRRGVVLLIFDVLHFDAYAAHQGSTAAGELLAGLVKDMRANLRAGDEVSRLGRARFGVLLADLQAGESREVIDGIAQRLVNRLHTSLSQRGAALSVAAGVAENIGDPGAEVMLARAGLALQRAVDLGGSVSIWSDGRSASNALDSGAGEDADSLEDEFNEPHSLMMV